MPVRAWLAEDREVDFYLSDQNDMYICLGFEGWRKDFSIGISAERMDPIIKDKIISSQIVPAIGHTSSNSHHVHWYYLHYYEDRKMRIWDNPEIWCEIAEGTLGKELCRQIAFIVQELKNVGVIVPTM